MYYKSVEPYTEPCGILRQLPENSSELSVEEQGFICGLLRQIRPEKIVEVGVSGGGTSVVIMNCLQRLGLDSKMYSVDYDTRYYVDRSKACGYQIQQAEPYLENYENHKLYLGTTAGEVIDEIGGGIDFLILDTIHLLPGELLDFIVCFPYLSDHAVVCLDDLYFNQLWEIREGYSTKLLFDTAAGEKFRGSGRNLGAFRITEETGRHIMDCFSALSISWSYLPDLKVRKKYDSIIEEKYGAEYVRLWREALDDNIRLLSNREKTGDEIKKLNTIFNSGKKILCYGAGRRGRAFQLFMRDRGYEIDGFIISDDKDRKEFETLDKRVYYLSDISLNKGEYMVIITAMAEEIEENLKRNKMMYVKVLPGVFDFMENYVSVLVG